MARLSALLLVGILCAAPMIGCGAEEEAPSDPLSLTTDPSPAPTEPETPAVPEPAAEPTEPAEPAAEPTEPAEARAPAPPPPPPPSTGEDERERSLRARLDASPDDAQARCELGYLRMRREAWRDARAPLEEGIRLLMRQEGAAAYRSLGACLYNYGRVLEGLGEPHSATEAYLWSLESRANEIVRARLLGIPNSSPTPLTPPARLPVPALAARARAARAVAALCAAREEPCQAYLEPPRELGRSRCGSAGRWLLVRAGAPLAEELWSSTQSWEGNRIEPEAVRLDAERCGMRLDHDLYYTQGDVENGAYEVEVGATYLLWPEEGALRGIDLTVHERGGIDHPYTVRVRLDGRGHVLLGPSRPPSPSAPAAGTFAIEQLSERHPL